MRAGARAKGGFVDEGEMVIYYSNSGFVECVDEACRADWAGHTDSGCLSLHAFVKSLGGATNSSDEGSFVEARLFRLASSQK